MDSDLLQAKASVAPLSRRGFLNGTAGAIAGTAIATSTALQATQATAVGLSEIERLGSLLPSLWTEFQQALERTESASDAFCRACVVPSELVIDNLPASFKRLSLDQMPPGHIMLTAPGRDQQSVHWIDAVGWQIAIDQPAYSLCLSAEMNRSEALSWLELRRSIAQAYESLRSQTWGSTVEVAEAVDQAAYDAFCRVEDELFAARPSSLSELRVQATAAGRTGMEDGYEIRPDRAAALVAAILHICEGSVA